LPIKFFYFEDFGWSFFGKIRGQKQRNRFIKNGKLSREQDKKIPCNLERLQGNTPCGR